MKMTPGENWYVVIVSVWVVVFDKSGKPWQLKSTPQYWLSGQEGLSPLHSTSLERYRYR